MSEVSSIVTALRILRDYHVKSFMSIEYRDTTLADIKAQAADRWVKAVNADGRFGTWRYAMARKPGEVGAILSRKG